MAITKGAKKAYRSSLKKRVYNIRRKVVLHDVVKDFRDALATGKMKEAEALIPNVYQAIDKAEKRGVIKKNTASRKKSRLMGALKRIEIKK
jgi:small subunit ribosomal protein S20